MSLIYWVLAGQQSHHNLGLKLNLLIHCCSRPQSNGCTLHRLCSSRSGVVSHCHCLTHNSGKLFFWSTQRLKPLTHQAVSRAMSGRGWASAALVPVCDPAPSALVGPLSRQLLSWLSMLNRRRSLSLSVREITLIAGSAKCVKSQVSFISSSRQRFGKVPLVRPLLISHLRPFLFPQPKDQGLTMPVPSATSYQTYMYSRIEVASGLLRNCLCWARMVWTW